MSPASSGVVMAALSAPLFPVAHFLIKNTQSFNPANRSVYKFALALGSVSVQLMGGGVAALLH